jgi:peptidoglycan/LPS O-acetylase OafA/YrhL
MTDTVSGHSLQSCLAARRDNFLLLRIVAAAMVIYGHSFPLSQPDGSNEFFLAHGWRIYSGDIAVYMFFVISGFMVSGSFLARSSLSTYLTARLLRIVPGYLAVLVLSAVLIGPLFTSLPLADYFRNPDTWFYITKNLRFSSDMAWTLPGVFETHRMTAVNGSLWTLPAEMRMYMLVAAMGVFGMLANRRLGTVVIAGLFLAAVFNPQLLPVHTDWVKLGGLFCLGILAQLHKERIQIRHDVMLVLAGLTYISYNTSSFSVLLALSIGYFCFWFAYRTPLARIERFGDPSYGTYLWGWPVEQVVVAMYPQVTPAINCVVGVMVAVGLGYLSWHAIERPSLALKDRVGRLLAHPLFSRFSIRGVSR